MKADSIKTLMGMILLYLLLVGAGIFSSGCATTTENDDWLDEWVRSGASYQQYRGTVCEVCGTDKDIEGCHIYPRVDYPELENQKENIVTLCRPCHEVLSHFRNTSRYWNPNLREIVDVMRNSKRTYKKYEVQK